MLTCFFAAHQSHQMWPHQAATLSLISHDSTLHVAKAIPFIVAVHQVEAVYVACTFIVFCVIIKGVLGVSRSPIQVCYSKCYHSTFPSSCSLSLHYIIMILTVDFSAGK